MSNDIDLIGERFARLVVIDKSEPPKIEDNSKRRYWLCICDCGSEVIASTSSLRSERKKSCNCLQRDRTSKLGAKNDVLFIGDDVKIIDSNGKNFYVDRCVYDDKIKNSDMYWFVTNIHGINYVSSSYHGLNVYLHRYIMNPDNNNIVDHIDGDGTNNRLSNLRIVSQRKNTWNRGISSLNTSGYKGVSLVGRTQKWKASICVNRKNIHLGFFDDIQEAVEARKMAEIKYYGEYSRQYGNVCDKTEDDINIE